MAGWWCAGGTFRRKGSALERRERRSRRFSCRLPVFGVWTLAALVIATAAAEARPERIRAGHPYYSDDFSLEGVVRDLAGEKNYEEVYQAYRYYEAVYDDRDRVVSFKQVERGEVVREDRYRYVGDAAVPVEHIVETPGHPAETTRLDPAE